MAQTGTNQGEWKRESGGARRSGRQPGGSGGGQHGAESSSNGHVFFILLQGRTKTKYPRPLPPSV